MKKAQNDMRVRITAQFFSPMTHRILKVGQELNVPKNQFWLKRLAAQDVEEVKAEAPKKEAPKDKPKAKAKAGSSKQK